MAQVVNYDFIVVGGGSSGSALASNLATKGPTLLIERGANHTAYPQSAVRQGWPQIAIVGLDPLRNEGSGHWSGTASLLGGGSALNAAVCFRGESSIFSSLGFDLVSVEETFEYLENTLCTSNDNVDTEYMRAFYHAWKEHGYEEVNSTSGYASWAESTNSKTIQRGRTILPILEKRRPSSYLFEHNFDGGSILNQGNLTVFLLTKAKRIIFNDEKVAVGVDINSPAGDASIYIRDGGKVFLNSGAYETPKLLMLSGIGPSDILSKHEIDPVYINEAVGQNLIDRKEMAFLIPAPKVLDGDDIGMFDFVAISDDYWLGTGHKYASGWGSILNGCLTCELMDRTQECAQQIAGALTFYGTGRDSDLSVMFLSQRRPITRGNVTLASSNYNDLPLVHDGWSMNYDDLSADALRDLEVIVNGIEDLIIDVIRNTTLLERLGNPSGMQKEGPFDAALSAILSESLAAFDFFGQELDQCKFSDLFTGREDAVCFSWDDCVPTIPSLPHNDRVKLREIVFRNLSSNYHMVGTCKAGAVVEKETLSVIGVKGLHIGDLSVLTQPVDTHPMVTAMSVGLLLGKSTNPVPSAEFEVTPIVLALLCMSIVVSIVLGLLGLWVFKRRKDSSGDVNELEAGSTRPGLRGAPRGVSMIWGKMLSKRSSMRSSMRNVEEIKHANDKTVGKTDSDKKNTRVGSTSCLMKWSGVSCSYKTSSRKNAENKNVTTLFNNFGCMREGEVTAIMGPSGASKSTLLDILAGRKSVGAIDGTFSIMGNSFDVSGGQEGLKSVSDAIQGVSAYIPQQEFFYPTQTCSEAVHFTANMKFGKGDPEERTMMIRACLDVVGLNPDEYASRKIGGELAGGINLRGLSGGERKRLALACVLALKPKMLFIDELTSGLDSENTLLIMKLLKDLSVKRRVATMIIIHQPSPDTFALFDQLILLSKGRCLFSDSCSNLQAFYESNYDENLPLNTMIADDLVAKASGYDLSNEEEDSNFYKCDVDQSYNPQDVAGSTKVDPAAKLDTKSNDAMAFKLFVVFRRNMVNQYIRNITNVGARLASYSFLAAIIGAVFWRVGITESDRGLTFGEADILLRAALFLMNVSYLLPFSTIPVFFADKKFFAAESALGLYPAWMYGMSQVILEFVFLILTSTVEAAIVIPMCGLINPTVPSVVNFLTIASILIISGLVGSTMIFFMSMWLPTQDLAFLAGSSIVTISLSLCGGFLPFTSMSDVPHVLQWLSPIKYSFQAIALALLKGTSAEKLIDIAGYNTPPTIAENIGVLYGIFIVLSILTAVGVSRIKEVR